MAGTASKTGFYDKFKEALGAGSINLGSDTIKMALVTATYTPNLATDQFLSTVGANTIGTAQTLASVTLTGGVLNFTAPTWTAVATGSTVAGLVVYKDTGSAATSPLIFYTDATFTVTCAATAGSGATSITVDPLACAITSGTTFTFGTVSVTTTASAAIGARSISVSSTSGSIAAGDLGHPVYANGGLPLATDGGNITFTPDSGSLHVGKI